MKEYFYIRMKYIDTIIYKEFNMEKVIVDGKERTLLNQETDNCPICDTPLKNVSYSWNMLHGNAKASCCGIDYQIKDLYVSPEKSKERIAFNERLKESGIIELSCMPDWIEPIRQAMKQSGIKKVNDEVINIAEKIKGV